MGQLFGRDESTRMWTPFRLFWTAGITTAMGGVFATGGCFVLQETFDPAEAIELIERERVTEPYYTRAHQAAAMEELPAWQGADFSAVTQVASKEAFERHPKITRADPTWTQPTGFGMSESCAIFAAHPWHVPVEERRGSHGYDAVCVRIWKGAKQHPVYDRENRCVRADGHGQGQDRHGRETAVLQEGAKG